MCFSRRVRLLLIVIAAGVSVSVETRKPIYRIRRYCKATSEYSPIRSIGLTLYYTSHSAHPVGHYNCSLKPTPSLAYSCCLRAVQSRNARCRLTLQYIVPTVVRPTRSVSSKCCSSLQARAEGLPSLNVPHWPVLQETKSANFLAHSPRPSNFLAPKTILGRHGATLEILSQWWSQFPSHM